MKKILLISILLAFHAASAQRLISNKGNRNQTYPKVEAVDPEIAALAAQVSIPNLEANIRWMQEVGIRAAETPAALETQNWLITHFESLGLDVSIHNFSEEGGGYAYEAGNVVAMQKGEVYPEEYIVISSHYDHQSGPGADDNASGTAGVMEIARILSQHKFDRTILYIPFNAEEYWMVGSLPFVEMCAEQDMNILACFNLDMLGFFPEEMGELTMSSGSSYISDRLWEYYFGVANLYVPEIPTFRFSEGDAYGGDHMPFNMYEYPALYIGDIEYHSLHPCYHQPCDTLGHGVNSLELAQGFTRAALASAAELANGWLPPQHLSAVPSEEGITVSWDAAMGSATYKLFKNNVLLAETPETSYVDRNATEGTEYFYHVTAFNTETGKESAPSNSDSIRFTAPLQLPYSNDFEADFDEWRTSVGWEVMEESGNQYITNAKTFVSNNYLSIAELQWFSIPDTTSNISLSFLLKHNIGGSWKANNAFLEVTTNRKQWDKLLMKTTGHSNWSFYWVSLNEYIGEPFVQMRIRIESSGEKSDGGSKVVYLDDISLYFDSNPFYPPPYALRIAEYGPEENVAIIEWKGIASYYNVYKDGVKINEDVVFIKEFVDIEANSQDICYQVTALYDGEESGFSEKACIKDFVSVEYLPFAQICLAPNPSSGVVEIATGLKNPYAVAVYDMQGRRILLKERFSDGQLDLSHLSKGAYILKIANGKHAVSKKIIMI